MHAFRCESPFLCADEKGDPCRRPSNSVKPSKKKPMRTLLFAFILMAVLQPLQAQDRTVKGNVVDTTGEPVIGATVVPLGQTTGTITDLDGNFTLQVKAGVKQITISFVGMKTQVVEIKSGLMKIVLQEDAVMLEETVVIGYTTALRSDLTGAISSVDNEAVNRVPITNVASALSGLSAGVNVTTLEGGPNSDVQILVRGGGSITQDSSPLYVVDGFPVESLSDIAASEIESIDILKDASSTAIYGAMGANGVILVSTKKGKVGREITFNAYVGVSNVYNRYHMMSPYEFVYYQHELGVSDSAYGDWDYLEQWKNVKGNDWQDELYGNTGVKQSYNLNLSGGNNDLRYVLNYTHDDENYIMLNSDFVRDNLNFRLNHNLSRRLSINANVRYSNSTTSGPNYSYRKMLKNTLKYAPVSGLTDLEEEEALGDDEATTDTETLSSLNGPILNVTNEYRKVKNKSLSMNAGFTWEIINGLKYELKGSYSSSRKEDIDICVNGTGDSVNNGGMPVAEMTEKKGYSWNIQNLLTYRKKTKRYRLDILLGQEMKRSATDQMVLYSKYYPEDFTAADVLAHWDYGTASPTYITYGEPSATASYFGRVDFSWRNTYYATFNLRADGTSVFTPSNRWGVFPGGSVAWRISNEKFAKPLMERLEDYVDDVKLRLSYGTAGNARVSSNWRQTYSTVTDVDYQYYVNGEATSSIATSNYLKNANLTWETKYSFNLGLDATLLKQRVKLTVDFYNDVTKNLILRKDIPHSSGYRYQYVNLGQTTNRGIEFSINGTIVDNKKWYVAANFNIAHNANRVDKLDGNDSMTTNSAWGVEVGSDDYRVFVGDELGLMWGYKCDGFYTADDFTWNESEMKWDLNDGVVDCTSVLTKSGDNFGPGHIKLKKLGGSGTEIDEDVDRTVVGRSQPLFTGGFGFKAAYCGFDLSANFTFSYGNDVYNANKIDNTSYSGSKKYQNLCTLMNVDKRWSVLDPDTGLNIMHGSNADPDRFLEINKDKTIWSPMMCNYTIFTDWAVEDGSFLRLSTFTLGYTLPLKFTSKFLLKKLRFYITGNNVFVLTRYSGQDPEVSTRTSTSLTSGCDYSAYPKQRSFVFGLNATF